MSDEILGRVLSGCRVERLLGRGGMGLVYAARRADGVPAVVKVLAPELQLNAELTKRFLREGRALEKLPPHPHVVRVFAVCEAEPPHLVMEHVGGGALSDLLRRSPRGLDPQEVIRLGRDIALGLEVIHAQGLLHRDVKPANVLLDTHGRAKVVDLGLAKDALLSGLTAPGQVLGTARYMAPEQWEQLELDARCDVFALGATLYALATGRAPFAGELDEIEAQAQAGDFTPPRELRPDMPCGLELVILQAMQPDPERRYVSAQAVAEDLEGEWSGRPPQVPGLLEVGGRLHPLFPGRKWMLGGGDGCDVRLEQRGVASQHAQIVRKRKGFVLTPIGASPVRIAGSAVQRPTVLTPCDSVTLGELELTFREPQREVRPPLHLREVRRCLVPAPLLEQLLARADPSACLEALERLSPDPRAARRRRNAVRAVAGQEGLNALEPELSEAERVACAHASHTLGRVRGEGLGDDPRAWIGWWDSARGTFPHQAVSRATAPAARLRDSTGAVWPLEAGVVLIGSAERCRVRRPDLAGMHASLHRLAGRWVVRDEESPRGVRLAGEVVGAAFLDPGVPLDLGPVQVVLELAAEPQTTVALGRAHAHVVDELTFDLLVSRGSPAVTVAQIGFLRGASQDWAWGCAEGLIGGEARRALANELLAAAGRRAAQARAWLTHLFQQDVGSDPSAWLRLLGARGHSPQVVPAGWPIDWPGA